MRSCSTNVARAMGYLNTPSREEMTFVEAVAYGKREGVITSYHQGLSSKEAYLMAKRNLKTIFGGK